MNSTVALVTEQAGEGFNVFQFKTTELAIYSYYIESNKECVLIDPVFDVETYRKFMDSRKAVLKYVFLTHYHADYLSGHT
jgi:hydroxyacylglutathione hydrolase